jgi:hypothetical protein
VFLRRVVAVEADAFRMIVMDDFDGVTVEDGDDGVREVGGNDRAQKRPEEKQERGNKKSVNLVIDSKLRAATRWCS